MKVIDETVEAYRRQFLTAPEVVVSAPGRVNLIGEHTDYNDGFVLPVAVNRRIAVAAGHSPGEELRLYASDLHAVETLNIRSLSPHSSSHWADYPAGVASILREEYGITAGGMLCIHGDIPMGAGLSSSAALAVACTSAFRQLHRLSFDDRELITIARRAEVEFAGVECGIMDQFIAAMGREGCALFLDCRTLEHRHVPLPAGVGIVVCDTGVQRRLGASAYNRRREECQEAVRQLAEIVPGISALRDVTLGRYREVEERLGMVPRKRARHVISENERVLECVAAFEARDPAAAGRCMTASHASLRDDYEVSSPELDAFVDVALGAPGVYGARMTGAGFGGCGICIVDERHLQEALDHIREGYTATVRRAPTLFTIVPSAGLLNADRNVSPP